MDDMKFDNETFLLGDFNINFLHNGKFIPKLNQNLLRRVPITNLVYQ